MNRPVYRLFIERKNGFENEAERTRSELTQFLGISHLEKVRFINRYDIQGIERRDLEKAAARIFSEPQSDRVYYEELPVDADDCVIAIEYLPGQYDQRADSAAQCLAILNAESGSEPALVRCARLYVLTGPLSAEERDSIRSYLINPVDSREASSRKPDDLSMNIQKPAAIKTIDGFIGWDNTRLEAFRAAAGLAMDNADIEFLQHHFRTKGRDPSETEIRVLDTYWSDHCRHTTFNTVLQDIQVEDGPFAETVREALKRYSGLRSELYVGKNKDICLMDMAVIGAKALKKRGLLDDVEESAEINACSIFIDVKIENEDGTTVTEPWLLMFKNETHNHPTEIEPYGGAATCIGGAIRDPLSGRAWVYQALRVTGAGDPTAPMSATIPGKLPQIKLTREAAAGFSSYGNQIGLTTGQVVEYYDPGFLAKRMELGAVIAATPVHSVVREEPQAGDQIILVGGGTGRDGIGGATGSSKAHTADSVSTAGAEVQKGNPVEERKIQRLFRNPDTTRLIRRCNDFGAGGVAVAVGELAPGLRINLDLVPRKYEGLNGTELAISESQERMAVVVRSQDAAAFIVAAHKENLDARIIAEVTAEPRLIMTWQGNTIVNLDRSFLDTAGAKKNARAKIANPNHTFEWPGNSDETSLEAKWLSVMENLNVASQRGLVERFDGSIGAASVLFPMGGAWQATPECGMAARIPVGERRHTSTASLMTMGYDPRAGRWSPFHASQYAVIESLAKILALGGDPSSARLTFQEYFERTGSEEAWGKPAAALLGALVAQMEAGTAAIGGKDSMSGTFHDITVPPTLVSFAVATTEDSHVRGGAFTRTDSTIVLVHTPWKSDATPDWDAFKANSRVVLSLAAQNRIRSAYPVTSGGIAAAVAKMCFGNRIGARLSDSRITSLHIPPIFNAPHAALFAPLYGSLVLEIEGQAPETLLSIGTTTAEPLVAFGETVIALDHLQTVWEKPLAKVFPPVSTTLQTGHIPAWASDLNPVHARLAASGGSVKKAKPLVILPVFPGTNCEYDMARAFRMAGADTEIVVLRNRTASELTESLEELRQAILRAEILALSGGFSAGDEPDGSGKFIANILRQHGIADSIMELYEQRKGLILGICNGFQALMKVGLLPGGTIGEPAADMPTLTYNTIGRHISRFAHTRIVSATSVWAQGESLSQGKIHHIPLSHGEGRVIIDEQSARKLFADGQIFTQYVDPNGEATMFEPFNPNGSCYAIEGMTDATGRILGKMGHSERPLDKRNQLYKNIPGNTSQDIFSAGVRYFM